MNRSWNFDAKDVGSVTAARRDFTAQLRHITNNEANLDAATLIFGELIANAIKYGQDPITAWLESGAHYLRLIVEDGGEGFVRECVPAAEETATGGRGVAIAEVLARSIYLEKLPNRFRITVELPVRVPPAR